MNKLLILIFSIALVCGFYSCEEKVLNPGDFSLKSDLEVMKVYDTIGNVYTAEILKSIDTTYLYPKIKNDTLKDAGGIPLRDAYNKLIIKKDTTYVKGNKTARYIVLDTIVIASPKNELRIDIRSNARWLAPTPNFNGKIAWYLTQNVAGGGDGTVRVKILAGLSTKRRPVLANQFIFSRDSMILYKITFNQKALNEK